MSFPSSGKQSFYRNPIRVGPIQPGYAHQPLVSTLRDCSHTGGILPETGNFIDHVGCPQRCSLRGVNLTTFENAGYPYSCVNPGRTKTMISHGGLQRSAVPARPSPKSNEGPPSSPYTTWNSDVLLSFLMFTGCEFATDMQAEQLFLWH